VTKILELRNDHWQVGVAPAAGAAVTHGRVQHAGGWVDLLRPTPEAVLDARRVDVGECASYVLLPWSNRVRDGRLRWRGRTYNLRVNSGDGTAIHGTARDFPWRVARSDATEVALTFDSRDFCGVNFPWAFSARVTYALDGPTFRIDTELRNEDDEEFPAGFGHHPYFQRTLTGADDDAASLQVPCEQMYVLEESLPSGAPVPAEERVDFRTLRPLGEAFVDDCLTARAPGEPIRIAYDSGLTVTMHAEELYSHVVVYLPVGKPFFAVEPVTNANDAFTLLDEGVDGSGLFVLAPQASTTATARLALGR
jgi:aldose 1-epimerase